jgi:double-strand break repair protein MRE11
VFSIHGNHDNPSREGISGHVLSSLDLLHVSNFLNYFGKSSSIDEIDISPILLSKGTTKVALYGLGNIHEERFQRLISSNQIKFQVVPSIGKVGNGNDSENTIGEEEVEKAPTTSLKQANENFFNIFLVHQNRHDRGLIMRTRDSAGAEAYLPSFLDLVIWGHEHECIPSIVKTKAKNSNTFLLQPGSTVATSICEGEVKQKHIFLVQVKDVAFKVTPIPLEAIRPMFIKEISLAECGFQSNSTSSASSSSFQPGKDDIEVKIGHFLSTTINELIEEAKKSLEMRLSEVKDQENLWKTRPEFLPTVVEDYLQAKYTVPPPSMRLPLIRLKVDATGFKTLSAQRFGATFVQQCANPEDILLFTKKQTGTGRKALKLSIKKAASKNLFESMMENDDGDTGNEPIGPSELHEDITVEQLVLKELTRAKLSILPDQELYQSLKDYIEGNSTALQKTINETLGTAITLAQQEANITSTSELRAFLKGMKRASGGDDGTADENVGDAGETVSDPTALSEPAMEAEAPKKRSRKAASATATTTSSSSASAKRKGAAATAMKKPVSKKARGGDESEELDEEETEDIGEVTESEEEEEISSEEAPKKSRGGGARKAKGSTPTRAAKPSAPQPPPPSTSNSPASGASFRRVMPWAVAQSK